MLGSNVSTVGGIHRAFIQAAEWGCECIQVYTTPSRRWEVPELPAEQKHAFSAALAASNVRAVVAHVPFLVNVGAVDEVRWSRSVHRLVQEVQRADELKLIAVVLHPGAALDAPRALAVAQAGRAIARVVGETAGSKVKILLENMAGQGSTLCAHFEEIAEVLNRAGAPDRVGVCFDTAHAFIAGYPLVGSVGYDEVLGAFDQIVGVHRIGAFHVNDAKTAQNSRHDRHAAVGEGNMGIAVFHRLMQDHRFTDLPMLLEIPERDTKSYDTLELLRRLRRVDSVGLENGNLEAQLDLLLKSLPSS